MTIAQGVNNRGQVVGSVNTLGSQYGWLRGSDGTVTRFRVNGNPTRARGITDSGVVAGFVFDPVSGHIKGFVTTLAGVSDLGSIAIPDAQLFEVPGAVITFVQGITNSGTIAGTWDDGVNSHGFVATPSK